MRLEVSCENRPGMAREILDVLSAARVNVVSGEFGGESQIYLHTPEMSANQLQSFLPRIRRIKGVVDVHPIPLMPSEKRQVEQQMLLDSLTDGVLLLDLEGRVLAGNHAAAELLRVGAAGLVGFELSERVDNLALVELINRADGQVKTLHLRLYGQFYRGELKPIWVPLGRVGHSLTGAVLKLKSVGALEAVALPPVAMAQLYSGSDAGAALLQRAKRLARLEQNLLIQGETGSGKTLLAQACHAASPFAKGPLVVLDCAALDDQALERELFGYQAQGAEEWPGLLERAAGGTLLLEQLADMSSLLQRRLLRFIETGRFRRVGGQRDLMVKVRIIATSQVDLAECCVAGRFRADLYHRLAELQLSLPPLRARLEELSTLVTRLLQRLCALQGDTQPELSAQAWELLRSHAWPGNLRELEAQLRGALINADGAAELTPRHFDLLPAPVQVDDLLDELLYEQGSLEQATQAFEARLLNRLYPEYPSSRRLAKRLGVSHTVVAKKLRAYGIGHPRSE